MAEPFSEPATTAGPAWAALRAAAESALPALRSLLEDPALLPQQALGQLAFVERAVAMVVTHLTDPAGLAKFRRLRRSALHKQVPTKPEHAEALLRAAGFAPVPADPGGSGAPEFMEWGPGEAEALAPAVAMLVLIARVQKRAKAPSGMRSLAAPLDLDVGAADVAQLEYAGVDVLEPCLASSAPSQVFGGTQRSSGVQGALIRRAWLLERLPQVAEALENARNVKVGPREKAAIGAIVQALGDARAARCAAGAAARLERAHVLCEVAQLVAGVVLEALRRPEMCAEPSTPAEVALRSFEAARQAEPDSEPPVGGDEAGAGGAGGSSAGAGGAGGPAEDSAGASAGASASAAAAGEAAAAPGAAGDEPLCGVEVLERRLAPALLECVPAFRLPGLRPAAVAEIVRLQEAPSFFTCGVREKAFEVSLGKLSKDLVAAMLERPQEISAPLLSEKSSAIGLGCAVDIGRDDKAVVCVIVA